MAKHPGERGLTPMLRLLLLVLGLMAGGSGLLAQGPPDHGRDTLLQVNVARLAATVRRDFRGLDTLLAPELTYIHSDGVLESKAELLTTLKTGRLRYLSIEPDELQAQLYGQAGVVTGRARMQVMVGEKLLRFRIRFTALYRRDGAKWVLAAWQATRLPDS